MFTTSETESMLDAEIQAALEELASKDKNSEEYGSLLERISKLHKLKAEERPKPLSRDTALLVAANVFGIVWLTLYEREHVISSKALSFILKPR